MGRFSGTIINDPGSITNEMISPSTDIDADKVEHVHKIIENFGLAVGGTPVASHRIVYVCTAATARIRRFLAGLWECGSSTSITYDLKKNGTTVLAGVITVTHSNTDKEVQDATISLPDLVTDDILTIDLAVSSSTGATGPFAQLEIDEVAIT